uniref:Late embryogenesis abundant protein LEA-2 subgroup domain-containing protein n=1 Tax=Kalanchoe fedtschenkoi TaxID=63787 RepID=A0A7N0SXA6_KALFE
MVDKDQVLPLAFSTNGRSAEDNTPVAADEAKLTADPKTRRRRCFKICGVITAAFLLIAILIIVLIFTLFRVRDPIIKLDGVEINNLGTLMGIPKQGTNITLTAHVIVKNPNIASFRYPNTTTMLYYHGNVVGEARGPPGKAKAQRSQRITASVDLFTGRFMADPNLMSDVAAGTIVVGSYTKVGGRIRMLKFVQRHVVVTMNCTLTINVPTRSIQEQKCKRHVKL